MKLIKLNIGIYKINDFRFMLSEIIILNGVCYDYLKDVTDIEDYIKLRVSDQVAGLCFNCKL